MKSVAAVIEELVLAAPLVMHPGTGVQVQVVVGNADESGHRAVSVYSRDDRPETDWVLNAEGTAGCRTPGSGLGGLCRCGRLRARWSWISRAPTRGWRRAVMPTGRRFRD